MSSPFSQLNRLLDEYSSNHQDQIAFKDRIQSYAQSEQICSSTHFSPGHITVSAVVLSPDRSHIALIFHPFLQLWLQPGGHVDSTDSSLIQACLREIKEEVQIDSPVLLHEGIFDLDIHEIPANTRKNHPSHLHLDCRFLFGAPTWDIQAGTEIKEAQWFSIHDLDSIHTDNSVRRLIQKIAL